MFINQNYVDDVPLIRALTNYVKSILSLSPKPYHYNETFPDLLEGIVSLLNQHLIRDTTSRYVIELEEAERFITEEDDNIEFKSSYGEDKSGKFVYIEEVI